MGDEKYTLSLMVHYRGLISVAMKYYPIEASDDKDEILAAFEEIQTKLRER